MWPARAKVIDEFALARDARDATVGRSVHLRVVIEFTNVCHHNCLYCGMRAGNSSLQRYTLSSESIAGLAHRAHEHNIRTVMIQGGDHLHYDINELCDAISAIREQYGQTILLCVGDRPIKDYEDLYRAGATQAIVKFETSNKTVYQFLRPHSSLEARLDLIYGLATMGFEMSSGFICGLPGTTQADTENDLDLISELPLFAASVSPFIPNDQSPMSGDSMPELDLVLSCIAQIRIRRPQLRIPAVSALNLLARRKGRLEGGQYLGLMSGANVLTVNYTPPARREAYVIYRTAREIVELEYAKQIIARADLTIE